MNSMYTIKEASGEVIRRGMDRLSRTAGLKKSRADAGLAGLSAKITGPHVLASIAAMRDLGVIGIDLHGHHFGATTPVISHQSGFAQNKAEASSIVTAA